MASADFSLALTRKTFPGKVPELSARAVRLYQMRLSVTVGFRASSHVHRPPLGLAACSCSYGRAFATDFFRGPQQMIPDLPQPREEGAASGDERGGQAQAARLQLCAHLAETQFGAAPGPAGGLPVAVPAKDHKRPE